MSISLSPSQQQPTAVASIASPDVSKLENDRNSLLKYLLKEMNSVGKLKFPQDHSSLDSIDLRKVDVRYVLDQLDQAKDVYLPLKWFKPHPLVSTSGTISRATAKELAKGSSTLAAPPLPARKVSTTAANVALSTAPVHVADSISEISGPTNTTSTALYSISQAPPTLKLNTLLGDIEVKKNSFDDLDLSLCAAEKDYVYKGYKSEVGKQIREYYNSHNWAWELEFPCSVDNENAISNADLELSIYEVVLLLLFQVQQQGDKATHDKFYEVVIHDIRPTLNISNKKHAFLKEVIEGAMKQVPAQEGEMPASQAIYFRYNLVKYTPASKFATPEEYTVWKKRQVYALYDTLLSQCSTASCPKTMTYQGSELAFEDYLLEFRTKTSSAVSSSDDSAAILAPFVDSLRPIIADTIVTLSSEVPSTPLSPNPPSPSTSTAGIFKGVNFFHKVMYSRLVPVTFDPDMPWKPQYSSHTETLTKLYRHVRELLSLDFWVHDICLVDIFHQKYLQLGSSHMVPALKKAAEDLTSRVLKKYDTEHQASVIPWIAKLLANTFFMIQNSVEHFYDWPLVRTQDLPNYVETYCYLQPMYKNELLELARSSFPPNFQKDSATEWVNHVAKLIQTAKTNQYESTVAGCLQPISVDRILNYVSIFDGQIKIESTVFLPVLNSLVPHTTVWESSVVLSMQKMKKDLIPCITKDAFTVNESFVTLIKNIDEILDKVKEMKREITKKDDISYADIDLNLSTVAEPVLRSWSREVDKTMAEYTKRAFNLDSFEPMDERNKYSQSVVELFTLCHANLKALLSFPLSSAIEIYVVPVVESLVTSVVRYTDLCGNVPTLKTDFFGTNDDPEPMKLKSGRAGSLASISGSGTINDPAENTKIYVKINNLHFAKGQLRELVSTLKKRCEELNICCVKDGFNWNHLFDRGFRQIRQKTNILLQYISSKLLYNDFRSIFAESLYSHASTGCSLRDILPKIDKRSEFRQCVHQDFFDDLLLYWMQCVLEGVEKAIFEIGSKRVFRPEDATALEEDMRELAKIFVSKGSDKPGLPGDVVSASLKPLKSLISTVMPLATEVLVEAFEQTFQSTDPSIASLSNPFCPYHLKRVICHRNDNAAKAFVKKYKIKGVKVKEEKS